MRRRRLGGDAPAQPRHAEVALGLGAQQHGCRAPGAGGEIQPAGGDEGGRLHRAHRPGEGARLQTLLQRPQRLGVPVGADQDQPAGLDSQSQQAARRQPAALAHPVGGGGEQDGAGIVLAARPLQREGRRLRPVGRERRSRLLQPRTGGGKRIRIGLSRVAGELHH
jgi:hypothetical protein